MTRPNFLRLAATSALVTLLAAATAPAQIQVFGGDGPRMSSTKLIFGQNFSMLGALCIQYGQPVWKDEYDAMADKAKGKSLRLGKDFWTTMNASVDTTIGGTKVAAGAYYLGIRVSDLGEFELLFLDAKTADSKGWAPFQPAAWEPAYAIAMTKGTSDKTVEKMQISLTGDDPAKMGLSVAWGKHTLSADLVAHVAMEKKAEEASAKKK